MTDQPITAAGRALLYNLGRHSNKCACLSTHNFDDCDCGTKSIVTKIEQEARAAVLACRICGEPEPSHVHNDGKRIEHYFTVGRGESDFMAALRWRDLAEAREAELAEARRLLRDIYRYWVAADEPWRTPIYGFWESIAAFLARTDTQEEKK